MRGSHSGCPARLANPQAADRAIAKSTGAPLRWSRRVPDVNNRRDAAAPRPRMDTLDLDINMRVNGEDVQARIAPRKTLVDFLRDDLCLTGTHVGCEHGVCGACAVRLDGEVVRGCLVFAVQCDGSRIETIEGLSDSGAIADLQMAFQRRKPCNAATARLACSSAPRSSWPPAAFPVATQFASISPAIIAAAPDTRRSSMRSSPSRRCARERQADNERTRKTADAVGTRRRA